MKSLLVLVAATLLAGCANNVYYFAPAPQQTQQLVYMQKNPRIKGINHTTSNLTSEVLFEPTGQNVLFNNMAVFWVYAKNIDSQPFDYGIGSIRVVDKDGKPVSILGIDEVVQNLDANKSKAESKYALVSWFQAGLEAAIFANNHSQGKVSGYDSQGHYVQGTYESTSTDPAVAYGVYRDRSRRIEQNTKQLDQDIEKALEAIGRLTLTSRVLNKGESGQGIVAVPLSASIVRPNEFRFTILLGDKAFEHRFTIKNKR